MFLEVIKFLQLCFCHQLFVYFRLATWLALEEVGIVSECSLWRQSHKSSWVHWMVCSWRDHFRVQTPAYHPRVTSASTWALCFGCLQLLLPEQALEWPHWVLLLTSGVFSSIIVTRSLWKLGSTAVPFASTDFSMMHCSRFTSLSASWARALSEYIFCCFWGVFKCQSLVKLLTYAFEHSNNCTVLEDEDGIRCMVSVCQCAEVIRRMTSKQFEHTIHHWGVIIHTYYSAWERVAIYGTIIV